jgi:sterol desaturase/sphingolipid hydroxylase (fatty acid hydroxylase superfamily)
MHTLFLALSSPIHAFIEPGADFCLLWLSTYLLGAGILHIHRGGEWRTLPAALFPAAIYRHPSARMDCYIWFLNAAVMIPLASRIASVTIFGELISQKMTAWLPAAPFQLPGGSIGILILTGTLFLAVDCGIYLGHLALHRSAVLWEFHKVHHSAPVLVPFTASRQHPVDYIVTSVCAGLLAGVVVGLVSWLLPVDLAPNSILQINIFNLLFISTVLHFRHSHIALSWGKPWSWLFVSPRMHHLHHSDDPADYDCNLGVTMALWDHLFGTAKLPPPDQEISYGIGPEGAEHSNLAAVYVTPCLKAWRRLRSLP